ncbi:ABC transporter ATP-binding protein [Anaerobacillus arseniciselenatis]|uniref:ABC transporter ATP-binding protein n=1 Tax=Anaerobacillus arseniciselenatis TaxID=85682 RepID=A0A1S2LRS7_9BACI|nr:ABC transporter ATP-binding protein [Anaerobacillus arseniciselenatis]OIJ15212.1 ABC transporter ATP-binding protein [Anaerobacillus arseniciselenatis]
MTILAVEQLSKSYNENLAVKDATFQFEQGRCVALLGPNGAGKTTILKMLAGLLKPTTGKIKFQHEKENADLRKYIGYLPQYPVFHDWMTGAEFLQYIGKLTHLSDSKAKQRTIELLDLVGISDAKNRRIGKYSGGMKQRLGIAQAIIHHPKLLLLDEPVSALDPFGRREVLEMIKKLKEDTTILFSTHVLNDAEEVSEDVIIINHGEIKVSNSIEQLRKQHQQAMIYVETNVQEKKQLQEWVNWDVVTDIVFENHSAQIIVSDIELAKQKILREIVEKNISIQKFEVGRTTLEDLFVKVVRG